MSNEAIGECHSMLERKAKLNSWRLSVNPAWNEWNQKSTIIN